MLDVRRLQALQAVARHGSIAAAARSLHFTAPAVSQQLAALERETDTALFHRTGRSISLTERGALLAAHADIVLSQLESAMAALATGGTPSGTVRIAAFPTAIAHIVAASIRDVDTLHPEVSATVIEAEPSDAERLLRAADADLIVVHHYDLVPRRVADDMHSIVLFDEPMLLACPTDDVRWATAGDRPLDLIELRDARWIVPAVGTSCHELVQRACGAAGFVPMITAQCTDYASTFALVAAGIGVALVPAMSCGFAHPESRLVGVRLRPAASPLRRHVSLQLRAAVTTSAIGVFVEALLTTARNVSVQIEMMPIARS